MPGRTLMIRSPPTALALLQVNFARGLVGPLVISAAGIITSTAQVATASVAVAFLIATTKPTSTSNQTCLIS